MKLLTITIPCFNSSPYMRKCIDSLLTGGDRIEIIIIDDGSTDATGQIADEYTQKYRDVVKVFHQQNGGHGEGINKGVQNASGKYFKVVDSDDWVGEAELQQLVDTLDEMENQGGVDLVVSNYIYEHSDKRKKRTIRYRNIFPKNKVIGWENTHPFLPYQYLFIPSVIFRTQLLRDNWEDLPKHLFYEDNLFVYQMIPSTKRLLYLDIDLYHYQIGHHGQSVSEQEMIKNYMDQIKVTSLIVSSHNLTSTKNQYSKMERYMIHELRMMLMIATVFARLNKTQEADENLKVLWDEVIKQNPVIGKKLRYRSEAALLNFPGRWGREFCFFLYRCAQLLIQFN